MTDGPPSVKPDFDMPDWMWIAKWMFEGAHLTQLYLEDEASRILIPPNTPHPIQNSEGENNDNASTASTISDSHTTPIRTAPRTAPQVYYISAGDERGQWYFAGDRLDIHQVETIRNLDDEQRYQLAMSRSRKKNEPIDSTVTNLLLLSRGNRNVSQIVSSMRRNILPPLNQGLGVAMLKAVANPSDATWSTIESDDHADTWCFGPNFIMDGYTGQVCDVSGFDHEVKNKEIKVGTGLTIFEDPETGRPRLLQVDQGLDFTEY